MRALFFDGNKLRLLHDYPVPRPQRGEALIRVLMAGICATDSEIMKGYGAFRGVPGHEFVGIVEEVNGPGRNLLGRRVVGEINCGCGTCEWCLRALSNHCPRRTVLGIRGRDGAFAEYLTLPIRNLMRVPDTVAGEEAVFTEPLAAAFQVTRQVRIMPSQNLLVLGDGKLGILVALVLRLSGAPVSLAGRHGSKLSIAAAQGVTIVSLDDGMATRAYDVVVEATGSAEGFRTALRAVKPRGKVILKSTAAEAEPMNLAPLVIDEITVVGSRCGPFRAALRALSGKRIDVRPLISARYPLARAEEGFVWAREPGVVKVILKME